MRNFVRRQRQKRLADRLLTIRQGEGESLRSYVKRFNREVLEVDKAEDQVQLTTFKARLRSKEFVVALAKSPPASMINLLMKAQKYMNMEDALAAIEVGGPRNVKDGPPRRPERAKEGKERPSFQQ